LRCRCQKPVQAPFALQYTRARDGMEWALEGAHRGPPARVGCQKNNRGYHATNQVGPLERRADHLVIPFALSPNPRLGSWQNGTKIRIFRVGKYQKPLDNGEIYLVLYTRLFSTGRLAKGTRHQIWTEAVFVCDSFICLYVQILF